MRTSAVILFLDVQEQIVPNGQTLPLATLRSRIGALAQLAAMHELPAFASSVPPGGPYLDEVLAGIPGIQPRPRHETTAFADTGLKDAIAATGRRTLVLAGVASEIVVQRTALDALAAGYDVQVAVDACSGISARTEEAAWQRIGKAGGVLTSVVTVAAELAGDFTTELGGATLGVLYTLLGS